MTKNAKKKINSKKKTVEMMDPVEQKKLMIKKDDKADEDADESSSKAEEVNISNVAKRPESKNDEKDDSSSDEDEDDEDLILEGVIVRNRDVSDSDDTTSSEESEDDNDDDNDDDSKDEQKKSVLSKKRQISSDGSESNDKSKASSKPAVAAASTAGTSTKAKPANTTMPTKQSKKKRKKDIVDEKSGPEIVQVEFTFCDMDEKYFHGIKTLLTSSSPVYAAQSSALADLMIENISVGTIVSTEGDVEGTVFGFASILNVSTYQDHDCIQTIKRLCLDHCPTGRKEELNIVLSGQTKRPAGLFLQGRMVNMPLEVVEVLHQQLVLDIDWAVENADGGEEERKSLDFGAFVRIAPTHRLNQSSTATKPTTQMSSTNANTTSAAYKYFEDEIFQQHAEFSYEVELPKTYGMEETPYCTIIVMTKTGHRAAMKDIAQMVNGTGSNPSTC